MSSEEQMVKSLYDHFNARDIEEVLSNPSENVVWANGMEMVPKKIEKLEERISEAILRRCRIWLQNYSLLSASCT